MDENTHVVYLPREKLREIVRRLSRVAGDAKGREARRFLLSAVAHLDGVLAQSQESVVAVYGTIG